MLPSTVLSLLATAILSNPVSALPRTRTHSGSQPTGMPEWLDDLLDGENPFTAGGMRTRTHSGSQPTGMPEWLDDLLDGENPFNAGGIRPTGTAGGSFSYGNGALPTGFPWPWKEEKEQNERRQATAAKKPWEILPATPALPTPVNTTLSTINGVQLWLQKYNEKAGSIPIVFDHGGLGYSAYFGDVIKQLVAAGSYVVAVDRRGHGRSTFNDADVFTYDMFANDIYMQLKEQGITKYNVVGWSDGAATTLSMLMNATIATGIQKAFVFAGFQLASDTNATFTDTEIYTTFVSRCSAEYTKNQPEADFTTFATKVASMEAKLPQFTTKQLGTIDGSKVNIVGAQYDEAVNLDVPAKLKAAIPKSTLTMLPNVSHFAPVQDPTGFTKAIQAFFKA